jgi:hypothetical protein
LKWRGLAVTQGEAEIGGGMDRMGSSIARIAEAGFFRARMARLYRHPSATMRDENNCRAEHTEVRRGGEIHFTVMVIFLDTKGGPFSTSFGRLTARQWGQRCGARALWRPRSLTRFLSKGNLCEDAVCDFRLDLNDFAAMGIPYEDIPA